MKNLYLTLILLIFATSLFAQDNNILTNIVVGNFNPNITGKGEVINNNREGNWTLFFGESENKYAEGTYKNGLKDGFWTTYLSKGKVRSHGIYKNGKMIEFTLFSDKGDSSLYILSQNGIDIDMTKNIDTFALYLYPYIINSIFDGQKVSSDYRYQKVYDDLTLFIYQSGNIANLKYWGFKERLLCEKQIGNQLIKSSVFKYKNGEINGQSIFFNNVLLAETGVNANNLRYEFTYYTNGNLKKEKYYTNNEQKQKTGKWVDYYENSKKKHVENYFKDELHGTLKIWDEDGNLIKYEKYKKGKLTTKKI